MDTSGKWSTCETSMVVSLFLLFGLFEGATLSGYVITDEPHAGKLARVVLAGH